MGDPVIICSDNKAVPDAVQYARTDKPEELNNIEQRSYLHSISDPI
jgi:hypothetical protein